MAGISDGAFNAAKGLEELDIDEYDVNEENIAELNNIHPVGDLHFRGSPTQGALLAKLSWINQVRKLDVKQVKNIDPVLLAMADSPNLEQLYIDRTSPSYDALEVLRTCPRLYQLSASDSEIDDAKMAAVSQLVNLEHLVLNATNITGASVPEIAKMKKLRSISLETDGFTAADKARLQALLPNCSIKTKGD